MKYVSKYKKLFAIAVASIIGVAGLLIWAEREDRIQTGGHPNSRARYALVGIGQYEMAYLSEHGDFARSLSKLKVSNRIDAHTIEFVPSESNLKTVVYRAIPDRFNWMMVELRTYTITIVRSNSNYKRADMLICTSLLHSNIVPKVEASIPSTKNVPLILKCSEGSVQVGDP
jgi:hypothetical protein